MKEGIVFTCNFCDKEKKKDEMKKGSNTCCKKCNSKQKQKYWSQLSLEEKRKRMIGRYGLSPEEFNYLWHKQEGMCWICFCEMVIPSDNSRPKNRVCIDHCHETGKIRGLLCANCNTGLGMFRDSNNTLKRAIEYLEEYS